MEAEDRRTSLVLKTICLVQIADIVAFVAPAEGAHIDEQGRELLTVLRALGLPATTASIQVGPCLSTLYLQNRMVNRIHQVPHWNLSGALSKFRKVDLERCLSVWTSSKKHLIRVSLCRKSGG
jgi:hypothetical protein